jgi:enamine deaminase RidA (YjgF/YER057c/UK114 family)
MRNRQVHRDGPLAAYLASEVDDTAYLTVSVGAGYASVASAARAAYGWLGKALAARKMQIVHERIFGSLACADAILGARTHALSGLAVAADGPFTYVQGQPVWGDGLAGVQLQAVRPRREKGVGVALVGAGGAPCGRAWERSGARFLILQDVHGMDEGPGQPADRRTQAERMFERAAAMLQAEAAGYADVVRTWIYLSDILAWYDDFNKARNAKYDAFGLMSSPSAEQLQGPLSLPASTGIQGENRLGAASVMDVLAVMRTPASQVDVVQMGNVRQADAFEYGSAFSRGACIREPDMTQIQISGTAAVDEQGCSVCSGDARAQALWTLDTVEALIGQQGAGLTDICQATVFLKRAQDYTAYQQALAERALNEMPAVCVLADVCRDELLFEMDGIAAFAR